MFQQGDLIVYGNTGVCRVEAVGHPKGISGIPEDKLYYTLAPLYSAGLIYAPLDTPVLMRPVLTREAAEKLIAQIPSIREDDCGSRDPKFLSEHYRGFFESCSCEDLLQLIKTLYSKTQNSISNGRKPGQVDQRFMKRAEELLHGELAVALGIPAEEVADYISSQVGDEGAFSSLS